MKKLLTSLLALMLTFVTAFTFASCGDTEGGNADDGIVDVRTKTITVGYTDYAPMNYTDDKGTLVGFDTELALMVFNSLGYEVRFKLIEWGNKYSELNSGTIDCIWNGFTANAEDEGTPRSEIVDFTYYYMQNAQCIIRKNGTTNVNSLDELEGKSVSFEAGSAGQSYVEGITANILQKPVTSQMDAVKEVNMGTSDYAVVDILLAESLAGQNDYADIVINEGIEIPVEYYAVGFKKGSELTQKVNAMFEAYAKIGYLNELAEKYGLETKVLTDFDAE
ncbi:MAG: transporter substrate-binding domain-containing protein [Clostridiales bacterium]|nr:transporter substrate-binding domain-containing protein [Clostridiales bacterium]